jgi:O-antigen ligase
VNRKVLGALLALGMVATAGPSVTYVNAVLTPGMRWVVVMVLAAALFLTRDLFRGLDGSARLIAFAMLSFAVLSTLWSPVPNLTIFKSLAYVAVAISYSAVGAVWVRHANRGNVMHVFWPLTLLALAASLGGVVAPDAALRMNETVTLFRGLTFNSNFLGMLVLGALPLPLWHLLQPDLTQRQRWFYYALLAVLLQILLTTVSRASILSAAILLLFFFYARGAGRFTLVLMTAIISVLVVALLMPDLTAELIAQYVYKGADPGMSVLASRETTWSDSLEGALQGGVFGLGYGASFGDNDYILGLGATTYGREKANVFLAIAEETGFFGLALFVAMLVTIVMRAISDIRTTRNSSARAMLLLLVGFIVAMTVHAQFEAWMFSPGGALTPAFWAAIGMVTGISRDCLNERRAQAARRFADRQGPQAAIAS